MFRKFDLGFIFFDLDSGGLSGVWQVHTPLSYDYENIYSDYFPKNIYQEDKCGIPVVLLVLFQSHCCHIVSCVYIRPLFISSD